MSGMVGGQVVGSEPIRLLIPKYSMKKYLQETQTRLLDQGGDVSGLGSNFRTLFITSTSFPLLATILRHSLQGYFIRRSLQKVKPWPANKDMHYPCNNNGHCLLQRLSVAMYVFCQFTVYT